MEPIDMILVMEQLTYNNSIRPNNSFLLVNNAFFLIPDKMNQSYIIRAKTVWSFILIYIHHVHYKVFRSIDSE